jgi:hypothetical protein
VRVHRESSSADVTKGFDEVLGERRHYTPAGTAPAQMILIAHARL